MISRREVVTAGVLGSFTASAATAEASQRHQTTPHEARVLISDRGGLKEMNTTLDQRPGWPWRRCRDHRPNSRAADDPSALGREVPGFHGGRDQPFYYVYDWHVRHAQQIQITRISDQRFAIQFMFTQLIVRWEQDANYVGVPFDRG